MRIAFDGGSFQQGILGGIHSVSVNFLNACRRREPKFDVTLVLDPRLGPLNPTAMAQLDWTPKTVSAPVGPAYGSADQDAAGSEDPAVRLFIDGVLVQPELTHDTAIYRGARPNREFVLLSLASRPRDINGSSDDRKLGVAVTSITLSDGSETRDVPFSDKRLNQGFYVPEATFRWTNGCAFIPTEFFDGLGDDVTVQITFNRLPSYPLAPGRLSNALKDFRHGLDALKSDRAADELSLRLKSQGHDFYFTNHFIPAKMPHQKRVAWAHDLIPVLFPQFFHPDARRNFDANIDVFRSADRIYTNSNTTLVDIAETLGIDMDHLRYAGIAADMNIRRREPADVRKVLETFGLEEANYIIMVSTVEPRKNHLRLLQAYKLLQDRLPDCPKLVMVGQMGWDFGEVLNYRDAQGLTNDALMLSNLSVDDLCCLYSGALFSVYPSMYEGFGLPVLESMECGTPVLTSNISSMAEIAADAALTVDPYSVEDISRGLFTLCTDAALRADLVARGNARRHEYTWDRTAQIILSDLRRLAR